VSALGMSLSCISGSGRRYLWLIAFADSDSACCNRQAFGVQATAPCCSSQRDWQEENVKQDRLRAAAVYCSAWAADAGYATWALRRSCNEASDYPFME